MAIEMLRAAGVDVLPAPAPTFDALWFAVQHPEYGITDVLLQAGFQLMDRELMRSENGTWVWGSYWGGFTVSQSRPTLVHLRGADRHNKTVEGMARALADAGYTVRVEGKRKKYIVVEAREDLRQELLAAYKVEVLDR